MNKLLPRLVLAVVVASCLGTVYAQNRPGSIYKPSNGMVGAISDKTAMRPGDLITVLIVENSDVRNEETADLKKETNLDYQFTAFDINPSTFGATLPTLGGTSADDFKGAATYQKRGEFTAKLTAIVMDVQPNGNLVLSGRREIRVDEEVKLIEFSGVIRRWDVKADNTITSELVANAKISYVGEGPLTRSTNRSKFGGWMHDLISWVWPF